jgi:hypothetical protein
MLTRSRLNDPGSSGARNLAMSALLVRRMEARETPMTRFLMVVAGGAIALASIAVPSTAAARCVGCGVGAGVVGAVAAGAIIAGAASNSYYGSGYGYAPGYAAGYAPAYGYGGPGYYGGGGYGYGYRGYGGATSDWAHTDRDLVGTR